MQFTTTTALMILGYSASTMASPYAPYMAESSAASSSSAAATVPHEGAHPYGAAATSASSSDSIAIPTGTLTAGYGDIPKPSESASGHRKVLPHECGIPHFPRPIDFAHNATVSCPKELEGHKTCSTDETMIAVCHEGKWCPKSCGKSTHGWELSCRSHIRFPMLETVFTECTGFEDWLVPEPNEQDHPHRPLMGHGPVVHPLHGYESASASGSESVSAPTVMPTPAVYGGERKTEPLSASESSASASATATANSYD